MKRVIPIESAERTCAGCTVCCEGYATGEAHGYKFYPGRKCHFVRSDGCSIYEQRPTEPCRTFNCVWLTNKQIPEWMKPNRSKVLLANQEVKGIKYITVKEAGQKLSAEVLSWLIHAYQEGVIDNVRYELEGGWNFIGSPEFMSLMTGQSIDNFKGKRYE